MNTLAEALEKARADLELAADLAGEAETETVRDTLAAAALLGFVASKARATREGCGDGGSGD